VTAASPQRVIVAGATFPDLDRERAVLAGVGAELIDLNRRPRSEVLEQLEHADALLTDYFACDAEAIASMRRCRVICQYGVGLDGVDVAAASRAGILVTHTPGYCVDELAEHTIALMLAAARNIALQDRAVRSGGWDYSLGPPMRRLRGRRLAVIGFGRVGRGVAERAQGLGLHVVGVDALVPPEELVAAGVEPATLEAALRSCDIVSLHAPLTAATDGLIGAAELALLPRGALLVNTARGRLVDQAALASALASGHLAGAGLDVLHTEPPPVDDPLLALATTVLTPHAGFLSQESLERVQEDAAWEVRRALSGEAPRFAVNQGEIG
jgi:D-3-phosphoglycerate dehydrogenase / 2-oxoglutarate reductase